LEIDHIDINIAFLNPPLKETICLQLLELRKLFEQVFPELIGMEDAYLLLNKALYGLKQALREWFFIVKQFFNELNLKPSNSDLNLFIGEGVSILLFVDDMLIVGARKQVDIIKFKILKQWDGKDLGPAEVFVGFQIERDRANRTLKIH
jgi:hypothetical protein